ncbi:MAG: twin-arginine translocation signal domain-containing protein, partial [SAR324 cluster bacterium]|nr:twin-arginine translocation signal domain-containing protein [SAR324 cluster bacterium]
MISRRKALRTGAAAGAAAGAAVIGAPAIHAKSKIRWRMQTYAGPALAEHV